MLCGKEPEQPGLGCGRQKRIASGRKMQVGGSATKWPVLCEQAACKKDRSPGNCQQGPERCGLWGQGTLE